MKHRTTASRLAAILPIVLATSCGDDSPNEPTGPKPPDPPIEAELVPAPGGMRKLTARQYAASVKLLFGDAAVASLVLPEDTAAFGLEAIGAADHSIGPQAVELYELSGRNVGHVAITDADARSRVMSCTPSSVADEACFGQIAEQLGRLAWRRTLEADEIQDLVGVALIAASEYGQPDQGVAAMVSTLLQSPDFIYMVEIGDPNPDKPSQRKLRPTELASRMSFFILGRTPDAELLDLAEAGGLDDEEGIRETANEMLARPEARAALRSFYSEVLGLRKIMAVQKDPEMFPFFTDETRAAIAEETLLFLEDIVWERDADAREVFDGEFTFVNRDNAWLYGLNVTTEAFQKISVSGRYGLLSKPSFLAQKAHPGMTSPTRRGLFVLTTLLCDPVPPPPPDVTPEFPEDDGTPKTMRMRLEAHDSGSCKQCHHQTDSIGLALEHFDAIGKWRDKDQGFELDVSGQLNGFGEFEGLKGVASVLREHEDSPVCMARQFFRQSMGHLEYDGEEPALVAIDEAFQKSGYSIQGLLVEIAASPAFRLVNEPR